jgi:hypothetical protein
MLLALLRIVARVQHVARVQIVARVQHVILRNRVAAQLPKPSVLSGEPASWPVLPARRHGPASRPSTRMGSSADPPFTYMGVGVSPSENGGEPLGSHPTPT